MMGGGCLYNSDKKRAQTIISSSTSVFNEGYGDGRSCRTDDKNLYSIFNIYLVVSLGL
jgi:hypothetical protein